MNRKVIIASENPVKIEAVIKGFNRMFPSEQFHFQGLSVPSEVEEQPIGDNITLKGAQNRARNAEKKSAGADFWIGIEGGVDRVANGTGAFAWIVIVSKDQVGKARTGTFFLPNEIVKLLDAGKELGEADDIVFGMSNSKQKDGAVGILTGNIINRTSLYEEAVILALIPFKNRKLYL